jgi:hypothetical protein
VLRWKTILPAPAVAGEMCDVKSPSNVCAALASHGSVHIPAKAYTHTARMKNSVNIEALENLIINDSSVMQVSPACVRASIQRERRRERSVGNSAPLSICLCILSVAYTCTQQ